MNNKCSNTNNVNNDKPHKRKNVTTLTHDLRIPDISVYRYNGRKCQPTTNNKMGASVNLCQPTCVQTCFHLFPPVSTCAMSKLLMWRKPLMVLKCSQSLEFFVNPQGCEHLRQLEVNWLALGTRSTGR